MNDVNPNELLDNKKQEGPINVNTNEQQVNQNPQNNEKPKKVDKNKLIIIGVIIVVLLVIAISVNLMNKNDQKLEENNSTETNNDYEEDYYVDDTLDTEEDSDEVNEEEIIEDEVEEDNEDDEGSDDYLYPKKGYDGYSIEKVDNNYYLMRNKKEVAKLEKNKNFKLYKDESDKNSKYIAVCDLEFANVYSKNNTYAYMNVSKDDGWNSILYNINTGKSKTFDNGMTTVMLGKDDNNNLSKDYVAIMQDGVNGTGYNLIDLKTFNTINKDNNYLLIGDGLPMSIDNSFISYNDKFVIVMDKTCEKHGLMDLNGKVLVNLKYKQLQTFKSEDIIIAEENGKFGAIDSQGKVLINFEYDGIDYKDGYFAVSKNDKLGVLDKTGKVIVPFNVNLPNCTSFEFKRDYEANAFIIEEVNNDELVIAYLDKKTMKKTSSYNICNNNYTYKYDYLVVSKDGKYKTYDTYKNYDENTWYK